LLDFHCNDCINTRHLLADPTMIVAPVHASPPSRPYLRDSRQVLQAPVPPVVQLGNTRPRAPLRIQLHVGCPQPHESRKQGLVQVTVLLEGHVLDHRGQLVVVPNEDDAFEAADAVLLALQDHGDEGLDLQDLV
jgi:hypothetical protein